ncbi:EAL domain-containing protein [Ferrimonas sp. SCSIO 43195]|uniref:EAL domain-containing protein n=1 Tax=Ferrimonas sp. SCSIO 43195 TaxID=2822844 RepID=UPI00207549CD|nr:EAL domain-containing protein [Ferrimonas sp. SCSIO 43195]USD37339.1 EAL domain-containing protein [Ferrimonas sp. SCSIO 43195]
MTLFRLLLICLVLLVASLTATTLALFVRGSQEYLVTQLASHGQDTATSFGLSLSPVLAGDDWVLAESMVDAIFDRGDFASLILEGGNHRLERVAGAPPEVAPAWFRRWVPVQVPPRVTEINAGWRLVATLTVTANPQPAMLHLYRIARHALMVALVVALLSIVSGAWILGWILAPLKSAQAQAEGLRRRRFIRQHKLPLLTELRALTLTMNRMVENSEQQYRHQCQRIEQLQRASFIDAETGLGNGQRGRDRLDQMLNDRELEYGVLVQVHLSGLEQLEHKLGLAAQQPLIQGVTELMRQQLARLPLARMYRMGQADFWILLPGMEAPDWADSGEQLTAALNRQVTLAGATRVVLAQQPFHFGQSVAEVEQQLHQQLQRCLSGVAVVAEAAVEQTDLSAQQARLLRLLQRVPRLLLQPVVDSDGEPLYYEVLARFFDGQRWRAPASVVVLAQRLEQEQQVDLLVLEALLAQVKQRPLAATLAVNLTAASLLSAQCAPRLGRVGKQLRAFGASLAVEIPEQALLEHPDGVRFAVEQLQQQGIPVWLDHVTPAGVAELETLPVTGIKLDPGYSRHLNQQGSYESLLPLMVTAAHARGVLVVAEQVEDAGVAERLWGHQVDGLQGFALTEPRPFTEVSAVDR